MPLNDLWQYQDGNRHEIGCLLEIQTVSCYDDYQHLAACWWPLNAGVLSKSLNVSNLLLVQDKAKSVRLPLF